MGRHTYTPHMGSLLVLDVVGLTRRQIDAENTPRLHELTRRGASAPMTGVLPGVTCSAQATMLTGVMPGEHGAVGNGWLDRSTMEIALWRQANSLVEKKKVYEVARERDERFTCAKLFWWWNMGADVDYSVTPRPFYPADGRKLLAIYSWPTELGVELERDLGPFPFFNFWGPKAGLPSTRWIADATIQTLKGKNPDLTLAYLPHLDYDHQRYGPGDLRSLQALREVDGIVGELVDAADAQGTQVMVVSEYGITDVSRAIHPNLALRDAGLLVARETPTGDVLDVYGSRAFAVADHQLAHVYVKDERARDEAARVLEALPGVDLVLGEEGKRAHGISHANAGDLVLVSDADAWFTYYYWEGRQAEPDFARTVDIHRKPGYDPCEMFLDPELRLPILRVLRRVAQKKLGFRMLMDVIPVRPELVRGSHGRLPADPLDGPVYLSTLPWGPSNPEPQGGSVSMTSIHDRILGALSESG